MEPCAYNHKWCALETNTKDSPLFTKEIILVYMSPFSISNTWPLHWQALGFSGNPGTCLFQPNQLFIGSVLSLIVHAVQTNPLTHTHRHVWIAVCVRLSLSLSPRDFFYRVEQRYLYLLFHRVTNLLFGFLLHPTTFHSLSKIILKVFCIDCILV